MLVITGNALYSSPELKENENNENVLLSIYSTRELKVYTWYVFWWKNGHISNNKHNIHFVIDRCSPVGDTISWQ